jgi:hypothetical protein
MHAGRGFAIEPKSEFGRLTNVQREAIAALERAGVINGRSLSLSSSVSSPFKRSIKLSFLGAPKSSAIRSWKLALTASVVNNLQGFVLHTKFGFFPGNDL